MQCLKSNDETDTWTKSLNLLSQYRKRDLNWALLDTMNNLLYVLFSLCIRIASEHIVLFAKARLLWNYSIKELVKIITEIGIQRYHSKNTGLHWKFLICALKSIIWDPWSSGESHNSILVKKNIVLGNFLLVHGYLVLERAPKLMIYQ